MCARAQSVGGQAWFINCDNSNSSIRKRPFFPPPFLFALYSYVIMNRGIMARLSIIGSNFPHDLACHFNPLKSFIKTIGHGGFSVRQTMMASPESDKRSCRDGNQLSGYAVKKHIINDISFRIYVLFKRATHPAIPGSRYGQYFGSPVFPIFRNAGYHLRQKPEHDSKVTDYMKNNDHNRLKQRPGKQAQQLHCFFRLFFRSIK